MPITTLEFELDITVFGKISEENTKKVNDMFDNSELREEIIDYLDNTNTVVFNSKTSTTISELIPKNIMSEIDDLIDNMCTDCKKTDCQNHPLFTNLQNEQNIV